MVTGSIESLSKADISSINVTKEAVDVKLATLGNRLAQRLASGKITPDAKEMMNEYLTLETKVHMGEGSEGSAGQEDTFNSVKAKDLVSKDFSKDGLIQLYPLVLNAQIDGGLRGGHHVLIFGPTEIGKSLVAFNACYGFLRQGLRVLFVENEDPASDSLMRMMTRLTGMTKYQILEKPDDADTLLASRSWDKFTLANLSPGTFSRIERIADEIGAQVIILNQLHNIASGVDQHTQALEKLASEGRNLAKRRNVPVISLTQGADSASGKTVLDRGDVNGSNVGIPGQCDLMVGVGATPEMEERNIRVLSFPKNKLSGNHTPITVTIDPFTSRILE